MVEEKGIEKGVEKGVEEGVEEGTFPSTWSTGVDIVNFHVNLFHEDWRYSVMFVDDIFRQKIT